MILQLLGQFCYSNSWEKCHGGVGSSVCEHGVGRQARIWISHCHCSEFCLCPALSAEWSPAPLSCSSTPLLQWLSALPPMLMGGVVASGTAVVWLHTMKVTLGALQKAAGTVTFPVKLLWILIPTPCIEINAFWISWPFFFFLYNHSSRAHKLLVLLCRCLYTFVLFVYVQFSSEKKKI